MNGAAPRSQSSAWAKTAGYCFRRATARSKRASWPNGPSPTTCPYGSRSSCTRCCGAKSVAAERAVVLLSGGLDSATALAWARERGFDRFALSVAYGQRHSAELAAAAIVARSLGVHGHRIMHVD